MDRQIAHTHIRIHIYIYTHTGNLLHVRFAPVAANKLSWHMLLDVHPAVADYNSIQWLETRRPAFHAMTECTEMKICVQMYENMCIYVYNAHECARTIIQVHVLLTISNCTRVSRKTFLPLTVHLRLQL